jgi:hypothetical protein
VRRVLSICVQRKLRRQYALDRVLNAMQLHSNIGEYYCHVYSRHDSSPHLHEPFIKKMDSDRMQQLKRNATDAIVKTQTAIAVGAIMFVRFIVKRENKFLVTHSMTHQRRLASAIARRAR